MTLFINCCVREESRTRYIADYLLKKIGDDYTEINLEKENLAPLNKSSLEKRTVLICKNDYSDSMFDYAKQFAEADIIVIAAPYWDFSFPASLKTYIENIFVTGIVSKYSDEGIPQGLCKAKKLYYITTAGGPLNDEFGYGYIKALCEKMLDINETQLIKAEMLDIVGNNPDEIIQNTLSEIDKYYDT